MHMTVCTQLQSLIHTRTYTVEQSSFNCIEEKRGSNPSRLFSLSFSCSQMRLPRTYLQFCTCFVLFRNVGFTIMKISELQVLQKKSIKKIVLNQGSRLVRILCNQDVCVLGLVLLYYDGAALQHGQGLITVFLIGQGTLTSNSRGTQCVTRLEYRHSPFLIVEYEIMSVSGHAHFLPFYFKLFFLPAWIRLHTVPTYIHRLLVTVFPVKLRAFNVR